MGKKRAVAAAMTAPIFPFPADADETGRPPHFSDYGFDPQLLGFSHQPETKRAAARRHHRQPQPLEPPRFKLQKPISKKHQHTQKHGDKQRRRWWSAAASAALLFFKRPSSNSAARSRTAGAASSSYCSAAAAFAPPGPLYFADDGGDDDPAGCACWSPAVRSGHLTAAELGVASVGVPYVSLRDVNLGGAGGVAPSMPIYLVT